MDFKDLKQHFGSIAKAAECLGIHRQAVYEWGKRGAIPEGQQYKIEVLTGGALKANRDNATELAS